jgi:succinate dehydrogenase / fumarate reductase cytochrome b subunit
VESTTADSTRKPLAVFGPKIASAVAIAPLGVWVVLHLWDNLAAFGGAESWERQVTGHSHPGALALSAVVVFAPLLIHTVWGIGRLFKSRPNNLHYPTFRNLKYLLQRLTAIGALLFICAHVWLAFLDPRVMHNEAETFRDIAWNMHFHMPTLIVYVLGTLGVTYHLANGIYGFAMTTGLAASRAALRHFERASLVLFFVLLAMAWGAIFALYQAGAHFSSPH